MKIKTLPKLYPLPRIASMREVQRNYRQLFDWVEKTKKPLVLSSNSELKLVVLSIDYYHELSDQEDLDLKPIYKNPYNKAKAAKAVKDIERLAKLGKQDVSLTDFVIQDRENH